MPAKGSEMTLVNLGLLIILAGLILIVPAGCYFTRRVKDHSDVRHLH
jgi:hypothetical protein